MYTAKMRVHVLTPRFPSSMDTSTPFSPFPETPLWPHLVDGDSVHVGVIHKPDDLVGEELPVVLGGQVGLCGL